MTFVNLWNLNMFSNKETVEPLLKKQFSLVMLVITVIAGVFSLGCLTEASYVGSRKVLSHVVGLFMMDCTVASEMKVTTPSLYCVLQLCQCC